MSLQLVLSLCALGACFMLLRSLRRDGARSLVVRTYALAALIMTSMSFSLGYAWGDSAGIPLYRFALLVLAAGLVMFLMIVAVHRFGTILFEDHHINIFTRLAGYCAFVFILLHILLEALILR